MRKQYSNVPWHAAFLGHLRCTGNVSWAASQVGVHRKTAYRHKWRCESFCSEWDRIVAGRGWSRGSDPADRRHAHDERVKWRLLARVERAIDEKLKSVADGQTVGIEFAVKVVSANRVGPAYFEWRRAVYERDGYLCVRCGNGGQLQAHHVKPWAHYPDERFNIANGETLCVGCHEREHPHLKMVAESRTLGETHA